MNSLEWATWTLVFFSGALVIVTAAYVVITYQMNKSSNKNLILLKEQNAIMGEQNQLLHDQTEAVKNQFVAMDKQSMAMNQVALAIETLPYDHHSLESKFHNKKKLGE
ncbi:MAG: hypothetical protein ACYC6Q_04390 [Syntrophales bacterium]